MREDLLSILRCPACRASLRLEVRERVGDRIAEGTLWCDACERAFPIERGIPRFVARENYAASFGAQWKRFRAAQLDRLNGTTLSRRRLLGETGLPPEWWAGKVVLDVGCGAGRFVDVAARLGARVVGLDYSEAVDAAAESLGEEPLVDLVQADIYAMPFAPGSFDAAYCIGVAQHTPDPMRAVASLAAPVRSGGQVVVTAYERRRATPFYSKYVVRRLLAPFSTAGRLRLITALMPVLFPVTDVLFRLPLAGRFFRFAIPVANYVDLVELSRDQRYEWALLDTLDMLAPAFDRPLREGETVEALRGAGVESIRRLPSPGLNLVGTRA